MTEKAEICCLQSAMYLLSVVDKDIIKPDNKKGATMAVKIRKPLYFLFAFSIILVSSLKLFSITQASASISYVETKLTTSDGFINKSLGTSVAIDRDTLAIGAPADRDRGVYGGAVYVFTRNFGVWTQQTKLLANDGVPIDALGMSLTMDGNTIAVYAQQSDYSGAVYVFTRNGSTWNQEAKIDPGSTYMNLFGYNLDVSGDTLAVTSLGEGVIYVFTRNAGVWTQQNTLSANDALKSVSLDGNTIAAGAPAANNNKGAVYVFTRNGNAWTQQAKLVSPGINFQNLSLGKTVDIKGDTVTTGSNKANDAGAVDIFTRTNTTWSYQAEVVASDGINGDYFGNSISLNYNSDRLLVGAHGNGSLGYHSGSAYLFVRVGTQWSEQQKFMASDGQADESYGKAVGIWDNIAAIGTPESHNSSGVKTGAVYVYDFQIFLNQLPVANTGADLTADEGSIVILDGSASSDPDGTSDIVSYIWDFGDGATGTGQIVNHTYADNGVYTATLTVTDSAGATSTDTAIVTINNVAPMVGEITAPLDPQQIGAVVNVNANFTDPGVLDTHGAVWDFGDGTTSPGTITEINGSGSVAGSHTYVAAGVYPLTLTITDKDGGSGQNIFQYIVVYDPNGGFVTGGGWIESPIGAYSLSQQLTGKANFGFVSKYQNGANIPTGNTKFAFSVADFSFQSTSYDWLVVSGPKAQYKGSGTINGSGDYGFLLTANDGQVNGGGGTDKFRLKVWDKATGGVIYDNQIGEDDNANASTVLGGGSIVIHN